MRVSRGVLESCRMLLGLVFVASGLLKAVDPVGVKIKVSEYLFALLPSTWAMLPDLLLQILAWGICLVEYLLGIALLAGIYRRQATRGAFALMLGMTLLTAYTTFFAPVGECGCFGDVIALTDGQTLVKNLVLLVPAYLLLGSARKLVPLYTRRERWLLGMVSLLGGVVFLVANTYYLPYIDFLPYKVGTPLREEIARVDRERQQELLEATRYIYRRGQEERELSSRDLERELPDSTWVYAGTRELNREASSSKDLPVYSFEIYNAVGENVAPLVLSDKKMALLLLSPDWSSAYDGEQDVLSELYRYSREKGLIFFALSPATPRAIEDWKYRTGAEYPVLFMDATTVKTIARSNPTLLILRDGHIVDKLSTRSLPRVEHLRTWLAQREQGVEHTEPSKGRIFLLLLSGIMIVLGGVRHLLRHTRMGIYLSKRRKRTKV